MRLWILGVVLAAGWVARAQEPAPGAIDPERVKAAMERLNAKRAAATAPARAATAPAPPAAAPAPADRPRRVVFVVDGSGSMMTQMDVVRPQVRAGIAELAARDYFNIVVESSERVTTFAKQMTPATPANVEAATQFLIGLQASGGGSFEQSMPVALAGRPDAVWLVTDGDVASPVETAKLIRKLNAARVPINTVLHFTDDGLPAVRTLLPAKPPAANPSGDAAWLLWRIAHDSGGVCLDRAGKRVDARPGPDLDAKPAAPAPAKPPALPPVKGPSIFKER